MRIFESLGGLADTKGEPLGTSEWMLLTQNEIDRFAEATGDSQWIHVDPVRAATGPFGTTIAHGFLTLALLPQIWHQIYEVRGVRFAVNYGLNRVRFPAPVPVDSRVRGTSTVTDVIEVARNTTAVTLSTTIEAMGSAKPVCIAESIVRYTR
ncbi:MaoC family dehydratase [Mycolicibacterium porcinum]|uniref:MaoC family dehydratase n=1 Tax=Mycolicibacterium porcinum TaxID=39693 RepID=UPI001191353D|nr:MaoC family dehydratase [Mycolicibacterium porcinum]TVX96006.1 MaoC family dehydratase [Mycolicibacterium porcinum]